LAEAPGQGASAAAPTGEPSGTTSVAGALTAAFALSLALPVLVVVGSLPGGLISALIMGFGIHQAWRLTAVPTPTIHGPFRVGGAGPDGPAPDPSPSGRVAGRPGARRRPMARWNV
jgi:hypothetical protein